MGKEKGKGSEGTSYVHSSTADGRLDDKEMSVIYGALFTHHVVVLVVDGP